MIPDVSLYMVGIGVAFVCIIISFIALVRETEDLHRLLLTDLTEIICLVIIALVGTDLAEALILPGIVVGLAELLALSEVYLRKEGAYRLPKDTFHIEIMDSAPLILVVVLVGYGIILSGFTGGVVAGVGVVFYFMCQGSEERFELIETISGYAWALWIVAFFVFMVLPQYWFFGVMLAGSAILVKVMAKMALVGVMGGESDV